MKTRKSEKKFRFFDDDLGDLIVFEWVDGVLRLHSSFSFDIGHKQVRELVKWLGDTQVKNQTKKAPGSESRA